MKRIACIAGSSRNMCGDLHCREQGLRLVARKIIASALASWLYSHIGRRFNFVLVSLRLRGAMDGVLRVCQNPECSVAFANWKHRHCCSWCITGGHSPGCLRRQRKLARAFSHTASSKGWPCAREGCTKQAFGTHAYCCRLCREHPGCAMHTRGCAGRNAGAMRSATSSSFATKAAGSSKAATSQMNKTTQLEELD